MMTQFMKTSPYCKHPNCTTVLNFIDIDSILDRFFLLKLMNNNLYFIIPNEIYQYIYTIFLYIYHKEFYMENTYIHCMKPFCHRFYWKDKIHESGEKCTDCNRAICSTCIIKEEFTTMNEYYNKLLYCTSCMNNKLFLFFLFYRK